MVKEIFSKVLVTLLLLPCLTQVHARPKDVFEKAARHIHASTVPKYLNLFLFTKDDGDIKKVVFNALLNYHCPNSQQNSWNKHVYGTGSLYTKLIRKVDGERCTLKTTTFYISRFGKRITIDLSQLIMINERSYRLSDIIEKKGMEINVFIQDAKTQAYLQAKSENFGEFDISYTNDDSNWGPYPFSKTVESPHQLQMLDNASSSLYKRLDMIKRAKKQIDFLTFIWHSDQSARLLAQELVKKAQQGVRVRILLDKSAFSPGPNPFQILAMKKRGIEVRYYNKAFALNPVQNRTHQKLLAIDNEEFLIGGRNIEDSYYGFHPEKRFEDRDVWVKGPMTEHMVRSFEEYYYHKKTFNAPVYKDYRQWRAARMRTQPGRSRRVTTGVSKGRYNKEVLAGESFLTKTAEDDLAYDFITRVGRRELINQRIFNVDKMTFVSDLPGNKKHTRVVYHSLYRMIEHAKTRVELEAPYFLMREEGDELFNKVVANKIPVDIITNSVYSVHNGYIPFAYVMKDLASRLTAKSDLIKVWCYSGEARKDEQIYVDFDDHHGIEFHSKTMVADNDVFIGTYNMDPRSKNYNAEFGIIIHDHKELANSLLKSYSDMKRNSFILTPEGEYENGPLLELVKHKRQQKVEGFWIDVKTVLADLFGKDLL